MRVLVFGLSSLMGGVESFILSYAREIHRQDKSIIFDFLVIDKVPSFLGPSFINEMDYEVNCFVVPSRLKNPFGYRSALKELFEHNAFDCFWFNVCTLSDITPLIEANRCSVPTVLHAHNSQNMGNAINGALHFLHKRRVLRYASSLVACSEEAGSFMFPAKSGFVDDVAIIPNAIDTNNYLFDPNTRIQIRKKLGIENDETVLGHVGRFHPQKNHSFLIDVFAEIHKEMGDRKSKLLLVGDGKGFKSVQDYVRDLGLSESVIFTGQSLETNKLYCAMDCFLFPSLFEGFGLAPLEAQASGLPCVITENSPQMVSIMPYCRRLSVSENPKVWAHAAIGLLEFAPKDREFCAQEVADCGFGIGQSAAMIRKVLISCMSKDYVCD